MSIQSKIKQNLGEAFRLYFILVTLITILLMIVGLPWSHRELDTTELLNTHIHTSVSKDSECK